MNIKKLWIATFLTISIAAPLRAETKWVEEYLRRYQPSASTSDSKETTRSQRCCRQGPFRSASTIW